MLRILWVLAMTLFIVSRRAFAGTPDEIAEAVKNGYDKLTQSATTLFNPDPANQNTGKTDPFFDKIKRKREAFFKKRREDQKKFFEKARSKNWDRDKLQEELNNFQQGQKEKIDQFMEKQQKKINQHTVQQQ